MKKIITILIATLLFSLATVSAVSIPYFADEVSLLTEMQTKAIDDKLYEIYDDYGFSVIIIATDYYSYPQDSLEYYLEENPYMESDFEGVVFGHDLSEREYYTIGYGYGQTVISDDALDRIDEVIVPYLKAEEYYEAYYAYLELIIDFVEAANTGTTYTAPPATTEELLEDWTPSIIAGVIIGIIIAFVVTGVMKSNMNTARKKEEASSYLREDTFNLTQSYDNFLYDTVTRTAKPKNNTSSSGGGGGGGGSSRGGRGGGSY